MECARPQQPGPALGFASGLLARALLHTKKRSSLISRSGTGSGVSLNRATSSKYA
jgi:hypothetical protein